MNKVIKKVVAIAACLVGVLFLVLLGKIGHDVGNEQIVVNQFPFSGNMAYWTEPGFKWQWFGRVTEYSRTAQIWFNEINVSDDGSVSTRGCTNPASSITYSDKGKGFVIGSVRIELPTNAEQLALIQKHYGSEYRLINDLVKPTVAKVILACGPLMTSLESVAEKRNELTSYATDQLDNGIYKTRVKTVERINTITGEKEKIQQAEIVLDEDGNPMRSEKSPFVKYGLRASQFAITDLRYEQATNDQIAKQRQADMQIITAKAEAAQAQQETIKIEEQGKQKAAATKWEQEAIKAKAVTEAQQNFEVARLAALEAQENAKKVKAEGEAEAYRQRKLVEAGLSPKERAEFDMRTKIGVAEALAKVNLPKVVMSGNTSGNNTAMDAVGLKMMNDLVDKMSK